MWFEVPVADDATVLGVIARASRQGICFSYFFDARSSERTRLTPESAIFFGMFSDLALRDGQWPIVAVDQEWDRDVWPMPHFGILPPLGNQGWEVVYADDDPGRTLERKRVPRERAALLPEDELYGAEALRVTLARLIGAAPVAPPGGEVSDEPLLATFYCYFQQRPSADEALLRVEQEGVRGEVVESADGSDWLLRVRESASEERMAYVERLLKQVAEDLNGDYDGYERPAWSG